MKTLLFYTILCLLTFQLRAQAPGIQWQIKVGQNNNVHTNTYSVASSTDSGYVIAGEVSGLNTGTSDYFVAKLNSSGDLLWQKTYGGSGGDIAKSITNTFDGGYIVAGSSGSNDGNVSGNHGGGDGWVIKLDSAGAIQWQHCYGSTGIDEINSITTSRDSGYIIAGTSDSSGKTTAWLVKIDSVGNVEWQNYYGGGVYVEAYDVKQSADGDFIALGKIGISNVNVNFWVLKVDTLGNAVWEKSYGGSKIDEGRSIQLTEDGGCVVAGFSSSTDTGITKNHEGYDYLVMRLDNLGLQQWQKYLGGSQADKAFAILSTLDKGFLVAGYSYSSDGDLTDNYGAGDCWISKLDSIGNLLWQKNYGGSEGEGFYAIQNGNGGGYICAGITASADGDVTGALHGLSDAWIIKLGSEVMPVAFSSFTAQKQKTDVLLQWQTATEQNSSYFNIQRSIDGLHFANIGSQKAAGTSQAPLQYHYFDASAFTNNFTTLYYRIEEVDKDGQKTYTKIVKVTGGEGVAAFTLIANPVHSVIRFKANKDITALVSLVTTNGKLLYKAAKQMAASSITSIPAGNLAAGVYFLCIESGGIKTNIKVVKE